MDSLQGLDTIPDDNDDIAATVNHHHKHDYYKHYAADHNDDEQHYHNGRPHYHDLFAALDVYDDYGPAVYDNHDD